MNNDWHPVKITEKTLKTLKELKKKLKKNKKEKQEIKFWKQETKEINGEIWISVKGTAKAYEVVIDTISFHIRKKPDIFKDNIIDQEVLLKKLKGHLTSKEETTLNKKWLNKFAFYKIGILLHYPPIIDPISKWDTQIDRKEFRDTVKRAIKPCKKNLGRYKKIEKKIKIIT